MKELFITLAFLIGVLLPTVACDGVSGFNDTDGSGNTDNSTNDSNDVIDNSIDVLESDEDSDGADDNDGENPDCHETTNGVDGAGGFLWKPISEADGNLVILFPPEFDVKFFKVLVFDLEGSIEQGEFTGFTNGDRQTWRFSSPGGVYTGRVVVDAINQECIWFVESPEERQD